MKNRSRQIFSKKILFIFTITILCFMQLPIATFAVTTEEMQTANGIKKVIDSYQDIKGTTQGKQDDKVTHTFNDLESGTYNIYAVVTDVAGNKSVIDKDGVNKSKTEQNAENGEIEGKQQTTETMPDLKGEEVKPELESANTTFTYEPSGWTRGPVIVKIKVNEGVNTNDYTLQYATNLEQGDWRKYPRDAGISISENTLIYARLTDGKNSGNYATGNVTKIDKVDPSAEISIPTTTTIEGDAVTANVTLTDSFGEIDLTKSKWLYNTNADDIGTEEENWTDGTTFTSESGEISLIANTAGTYYLHVLSVDQAGNRKEFISSHSVTVNSANVAPKIIKMDLDSKTTDSLTIKATASDDDGDQLTYTLYAGTTQGIKSYTSTPVTETSGQEVTLQVTGLSEYTDYYYTVEVTDSKASVEKQSEVTVKTYCPGNQSCSRCHGSGRVGCGYSATFSYYEFSSTAKCSNGHPRADVAHFTCIKGHDVTITISHRGNCGTSGCVYCGTDRNTSCNKSVTCPRCGGNGGKISCPHNHDGQHDD